MGTKPHPTTRVPTDDMNILRTRLKRDLSDLDQVTNVRDDLSTRNGVVFETTNHSLMPEVMRVLSDHDAAFLDTQPKDIKTHSAHIRHRNTK